MKIPGNAIKDSGKCFHFSIAGNTREDSGEGSRKFREMFRKIPGNVQEDSEECYQRFRGTFNEILVSD